MELSQYFKSVLRWWWLLLLSTGIAAVASYYASSQQPRIYQTTTTLMVGQVIQKANPTGQDFSTIERLAESYAQMAHRQPILQATIDSLGLKMSWQALKGRVNAYSIPRTQLLAIRVQDTSPGIDPAALPHIFERFYRGDAAQSGPGAPAGFPRPR